MRSILITLLVMCQSYNAISQSSWLTPWKGRQSIDLTNYNLMSATDYQVKLTLPYMECMDSTFNDIRFTDEASEIIFSHWIEYVEPGVRAVVYVKVDNLPFYGTRSIYWYFDNNEAENISDPYATMLLYDDFDIDSGWNLIGNESTEITTLIDGTTILHKYASCHSDGVWKELGDTYSNFKLIAKDYRPIQSPGGKPCKMHIYGVENAQFEGINFRRDGRNGNGNGNGNNGNGNGNQPGEIGLHTRKDGSETNIAINYADQPRGNWYRTEVSYCLISLFNTNAQLWSADMNLISNVYHYDYTMFDFDRFTLRGGHPYLLDYIAIGQKLCIEPFINYGEVETCPSLELISFTADHCDDGNGEIVFIINGGQEPYEVCWYLESDSIGTSTIPTATDTVYINELSQGTYTVKIKDDNGCEN